MPYKFDKMRSKRKVAVKDLNPMLTCSLCEGYLIDATVLADCLHVFCRGCIIKYFDNCRTACPNCNIIYKKKNQICFRSDPILQSLVYKLVPNLYSREMQTREDFYRSTGVRANSSCSDDSVIDKERDNLKDQENMVTSNVGEKSDFFSSDDMISLSMEYYRSHLDDTAVDSEKDKHKNTVINSSNESASDNKNVENISEIKVDKSDVKTIPDEIKSDSAATSDSKSDNKDGGNAEEDGVDGKRYLKCPAAVSMQLLQKFVRMKYGLTLNHRVDIIYKGEILPDYFTLIDVAYTFKWKREKPMRFFYRIFSPMKIKPIKIINTTSTSGTKLLQIVQVDDKPKPEKIEKTPEKLPEKPPTPKTETPKTPTEETEAQSFDKETLMANLQLQSTKKSKTKSPEKEKETEKEPVCVYEYVEPDKEEIKRFAEKRDREWALQKKLDERNGDYYVSKKRKKSKHSKNESVHKKRKLHAEITSNEEEDLKLKVKITPHNSHKHKHHRNSQSHSEKNYEISTKEKLLQMRQVRHKHISSEDKTVQTVPSNNVTKQSIVDRIHEKLKINREKEMEKKKETENKQVRFVEPAEKVAEPQTEKKEEIKNITINLVHPPKDTKKPSVQIVNKDMRAVIKEWGASEKPAQVVKVEKSESEKQKTFLKSFQSYTEKYNLEKIKLNTMEAKRKQNLAKINSASSPITIEQRRIGTPPAGPSKTEKIEDATPKLLHKYPPGFTVSKIEAGVKRKAENDNEMADKRPSLEITLIPPTSQSQLIANRVANEKAAQKRPLPSTIPLDRIRKSINLKSGISIIPKTPDVCDNIGALDLSNKSPESSPKPATTITKTVNGVNMLINSRNLSNLKPSAGTEKPTNLSNLQMLSKVASEHPILNKLQQQAQNIVKSPRPNLPSLHSLNTTTVPSSTVSTPTITTPKPNLPKLPKLTEISKTQFKITGVNHIRSPRPNPNLNIRNIPNPSLLISKQTQNRQISAVTNPEKDSVSIVPSPVSAKTNSIVEKQEIPV